MLAKFLAQKTFFEQNKHEHKKIILNLNSEKPKIEFFYPIDIFPLHFYSTINAVITKSNNNQTIFAPKPEEKSCFIHIQFLNRRTENWRVIIFCEFFFFYVGKVSENSFQKTFLKIASVFEFSKESETAWYNYYLSHKIPRFPLRNLNCPIICPKSLSITASNDDIIRYLLLKKSLQGAVFTVSILVGDKWLFNPMRVYIYRLKFPQGLIISVSQTVDEILWNFMSISFLSNHAISNFIRFCRISDQIWPEFVKII